MNRAIHMSSAERVLWRIACQAALAAARAPESAARAKELKKALAGSGDWLMPDQRSLPRACFHAFWTVAKAWAIEPEVAVRAALADRLAALAETAGDMLDGIGGPRDVPAEMPSPPKWTERRDIS